MKLMLAVLLTIIARGPLVSLTFPSSVCLVWTSEGCVGDDRALTSSSVFVQYNYTNSHEEEEVQGPVILQKTSGRLMHGLQYPNINSLEKNNDSGVFRRIWYKLDQPEHGGGTCNCVTVYFDQNCTTTNRWALMVSIAPHQHVAPSLCIGL